MTAILADFAAVRLGLDSAVRRCEQKWIAIMTAQQSRNKVAPNTELRRLAAFALTSRSPLVIGFMQNENYRSLSPTAIGGLD